MHNLKRLFIVVLFLKVLVSCSDKEEKKFTEDTFFIGYKKLIVESKEIGDKFPMAVMYPTTTKSKPVKIGPFGMNLAIGAKIANYKYPLIIISHGSGGSNLGHRSIVFSLIKKGFIVGMPLHPRNNYEDNTDEGTHENWLNRPKHITSAIDHLFTDKQFSGKIQKGKVAVIGHSAGGYTALTLAGGLGNTQHIINLCQEKPDFNRNFCGLAKDNKISPKGLKGLSDSRVKAIVLMAPVGILFQGKGALDRVTIPVFLITAEKDKELIEPYHSELIAKALKRRSTFTHKTIQNAGHYSFITPFPESIKSEVGIVANDPEDFVRVDFHKELSKYITDYLNDVFK